MEIETCTYSWLRKILGPNTYNETRGLAKKCIPIASLVLVVVFVLSQFVYWNWLSEVVDLLFGGSLIFIAYILGLITLLDVGVNVEMGVDRPDHYSRPKNTPKAYKATIVWGICLIIMAIAAVYFTNKYRNNYAFECETFLVDESNGVYHIKDADCQEYDNAVSMMGYQIEGRGFTFCESCKDWTLEMREYDALRGSKR